MLHRLAACVCGCALVVASGGCIVGDLIGGMAQNLEYQKQIEVPAEYTDLAGRDVAILVDTEMSMMYEHPRVASSVAFGVFDNIRKGVEGARVLPPAATMRWQYMTPSWNLMAYDDIAKELGVDRLIIIDLYEYRLHPPGNRYEWQGVAAANVRIIEADESAIDPNFPAAEFNVIARYPRVDGVVLDSASARNIEAGLLIEFVRQTVWLFYEHKEPMYPDRYRPELER